MASGSPVNPDMLLLARELRGITQTKLAELSGVPRPTLSKYEAGVVTVQEQHVPVFAEVLQLPESFFKQNEIRIGAGRGHVYPRKRQSLTAQTWDQIVAAMNVHRIHVTKLVRDLDFEPILPLPRFDIEDYSGGAVEVAQLVRAAWQTARGPIRDLTGLVERTGCVVLIRSFKTQSLDGVNMNADGAIRCLLYLNSDFGADRLRFTLAHELGHMVMHTLHSPNAEKEADAFAGELLMPAEDVRVDLLRPLSVEYLMRLKEVWKVSAAALARRAHDLEIIDKDKYTSLFKRLSMLGMRKGEPTYFERERPELLQRLFEAHINELQYNAEDLAAILHLREEELLSMYEDELAGLLPSKKFKLTLSKLSVIAPVADKEDTE